MIVVLPCFTQESFQKTQSADIWIAVMEALASDVLKAYRDCCYAEGLPPQRVDVKGSIIIDDQPEDLRLIVLMPVPDQSMTRGEEDDQADLFEGYIQNEFGGHLQELSLSIDLKISVVPVYRATSS